MRFSLAIVALALAFSIALATVAVANDERPDERTRGEFFERQIRPLLAKRCYECHSTETAEDSGNLALDGSAGLVTGGTRGPILAGGKPDESLLITAIRYGDPKLQMPPSGKLEDREIELLVKWVQEGAFVPEYGTALQKKGKEVDWTTARKFWSFQPLSPQRPPRIRCDAEGAQPIDAFVHSELLKNELAMSTPADKRTMVRRVFFDLLGLPPKIDDVTEYMAEDRPDAYERLVDRLLASPHFGERQARYWLDLVRYTDVTPSWLKNADQAWMYRDWVVRALNDDLPYNEFVKRQLAADVIEDTAPEDLAALGLIGLSPTYWKELKLAPSVIEVIVADEWDERVDAVSRTFLGLTVACARCHDHKFDPITSRDYYALAGIFASTQMADRPLLSSPFAEQVVDARARVDKLEESLKGIKDKESDEAKILKEDIEAIRKSTPHFEAKMAHTVEEASLYVLPDGPDATRLDVQKNQPRNLPVFRRGNPANHGEIIPRRFIEVLSSEIPKPFVSGSGRREFADALFREASGLTARVMVNRIWSHHFGRGLVTTPSDFGAQGDRPSHPALLEWLAAEFAGTPDSELSRNWKFKRLHRQLVTSATYRQDSRQGSDLRDPENRWLTRMNRGRLDVEPWRDAMLVASGNLDATMAGPAVELDAPNNRRRTIYGKVGRDEQTDLLRLFDFPPPTNHSPARDVTTTPLQQLFVLNSEFMENQATGFATRIHAELPNAKTTERITGAYEILFQRLPNETEMKLGQRFLTPNLDESQIESHRWNMYLQSLFGLNELLFID